MTRRFDSDRRRIAYVLAGTVVALSIYLAITQQISAQAVGLVSILTVAMLSAVGVSMDPRGGNRDDASDAGQERESSRWARVWWAVKTPGRLERFNRWRKSPATVTRGYLAFRDLILLGFVIAIVMAGVTTVDSLREDDCEAENLRRTNTATVAMADVTSDRNIWLAIDDLIEGGIPEPARTIIFEELDAREDLITVSYAAQPCP